MPIGPRLVQWVCRERVSPTAVMTNKSGKKPLAHRKSSRLWSSSIRKTVRRPEGAYLSAAITRKRTIGRRPARGVLCFGSSTEKQSHFGFYPDAKNDLERIPVGSSKVWRRGWDSNPRSLTGQRFSRPPDSAALAPLRIRNLTDISCSCHAFLARDPFRLRAGVVKNLVKCFPIRRTASAFWLGPTWA